MLFHILIWRTSTVLNTVRCSMLTKRLRQIRNARHFQFALNLVFTAQWFRFGGQRCSLLNAALCIILSVRALYITLFVANILFCYAFALCMSYKCA